MTEVRKKNSIKIYSQKNNYYVSKILAELNLRSSTSFANSLLSLFDSKCSLVFLLLFFFLITFLLLDTLSLSSFTIAEDTSSSELLCCTGTANPFSCTSAFLSLVGCFLLRDMLGLKQNFNTRKANSKNHST